MNVPRGEWGMLGHMVHWDNCPEGCLTVTQIYIQSKNDSTENLHQSLTYTLHYHHKLYQLDKQLFNIKSSG